MSVSSQRPPFLPGGICNGSGKEPDLFKQVDDGQTDEFQNFHSNDFGFNSPQSARGGKRDEPATTSVFMNASL
jgi:hypothetical protein